MNIILGGTHGLGAEIAKQLRESGQSAYAIGRSYIEAQHGLGMAADLSSETDIKLIKEYIRSTHIDGFYWIAGYGYMGNFADQLDVLRMSLVNFTNVLPIAHTAWRRMRKSDDAKFVVVSSTTGLKARANEAVYAATKHAQVGLTRSLGLEAERLNLPFKVSLFLPGGMQTPFWDDKRPDTYDSFLDPVKVAAEIINDIANQEHFYFERTIDRGSL